MGQLPPFLMNGSAHARGSRVKIKSHTSHIGQNTTLTPLFIGSKTIQGWGTSNSPLKDKI